MTKMTRMTLRKAISADRRSCTYIQEKVSMRHLAALRLSLEKLD